ncbi:MAG: hypothetical protein RL725_650, partial [Actinomycetota bacterium]
ISEGLRSASGEVDLSCAIACNEPLLANTPSITYNGSLPAVMEPTPRTLTDKPAPGEPEVC